MIAGEELKTMEIQAYQGYFQNGRFISPEQAAIPENVEVYIMVTGRGLSLERPEPPVKKAGENEIAERMAMIRSLTGIIPPDFDLESIKAERIAKKGLTE
jgi:hypothetical protein